MPSAPRRRPFLFYQMTAFGKEQGLEIRVHQRLSLSLNHPRRKEGMLQADSQITLGEQTPLSCPTTPSFLRAQLTGLLLPRASRSPCSPPWSLLYDLHL